MEDIGYCVTRWPLLRPVTQRSLWAELSYENKSPKSFVSTVWGFLHRGIAVSEIFHNVDDSECFHFKHFLPQKRSQWKWSTMISFFISRLREAQTKFLLFPPYCRGDRSLRDYLILADETKPFCTVCCWKFRAVSLLILLLLITQLSVSKDTIKSLKILLSTFNTSKRLQVPEGRFGICWCWL